MTRSRPGGRIRLTVAALLCAALVTGTGSVALADGPPPGDGDQWCVVVYGIPGLDRLCFPAP